MIKDYQQLTKLIDFRSLLELGTPPKMCDSQTGTSLIAALINASGTYTHGRSQGKTTGSLAVAALCS